MLVRRGSGVERCALSANSTSVAGSNPDHAKPNGEENSGEEKLGLNGSRVPGQQYQTRKKYSVVQSLLSPWDFCNQVNATQHTFQRKWT